jgi:hypothetical protein
MSQKSLENQLNQIYGGLHANNELLKEIGRNLQSLQASNSFWNKMIANKIFDEEELGDILLAEKAWYQVAFNVSQQPVSREQIMLLGKYNLLDGAQIAHMLSRLK